MHLQANPILDIHTDSSWKLLAGQVEFNGLTLEILSINTLALFGID